MPSRILFTGASAPGVSTLAQSCREERRGAPGHARFCGQPAAPKHNRKREPAERLRLLAAAFASTAYPRLTTPS
jgi:hypothetical protein